MRDVLRITAACLLLMLSGAIGAYAQSAEELNGKWIETSEEAGEIYYAEFGGDGRVAIDIFDVQYGFYVYDEKKHRLTILSGEDDRENIDADNWADIRVQGSKLTITKDEQKVVLDRVDRPEEAVTALVGRWQVNGEQSSPEIVGEDREVRMFMTFNNDGSASYEELEEALRGTYVVDAEQGTIEITINDDTESGTYKIENGKLTLNVADETHVFTRPE